jgi:hypothetical protein
VAQGTDGSEPGGSDGPEIRWEPPEPDPDEESVAVPAFVPVQRRAAPTDGEVEDAREPEPDISWEQQPVLEDPPPAPKGQWWAGWLADPRGRHEFRYWDGSRWTDNVADSGLAGIDPV